LALTVSDSNYQFLFDADVVDEIGIGRYDYHTDTAPLMDLTEYGGSIKGVSREHAAIIRQHGSLCIVDRGSANGTYLNGQRLQPDEPWLLRDGDNVRLGQLVLHVSFVSSS
jgi:pSer/pThr/pTyr-binding forkhead associated (FHA) protein